MFTLASLLDRLGRLGDRIAVLEVHGDRSSTWTYRDLSRRSRALARGLVREGVRPGERIGLFAPNGANWIVARLAIAASGAVAVAIDDLTGGGGARSIARASGVQSIFTVTRHLDGLKGIPKAFLIEPDAAPNDSLVEATMVRSWASLFDESEARLPSLAGDAPAMLVHTSGTTGDPKLFCLANTNIEPVVGAIAELDLVGADDRLLMPLPLHHAYPFIVGVLVPLAVGATVVLPEAPSGPKIVDALGRGEATAMIGVPRLYEALVDGMEARAKAAGSVAAVLFSALLGTSIWAKRRIGLSLGQALFPQVHNRLGPHLRLLVSAGAKLDPVVIWKLEGLGFTTLSGYGLAETASAFTGNVPGARRIGSEGRPLVAGSLVRIADPDAKGTGEIQLRGPNVFAGYLDNPEATRAAFTEDGWFRTGDLGSVDADGFVTVSGRLNEIIVLGGGKKVFPEELEKRYGASPFIREMAVLERHGALVAVVLPDFAAIRASANSGVEDVVRVALASAAKNLASHERLSGFAIVRQPLPVNRLGKYQRFLLPKLYDDALAGGGRAAPVALTEDDRALLSSPTAAAAWRVLEGRYAGRGLAMDADPQLDLGIDSLEWLGLGLELEGALGIRLAEQDFADVSQVRDLLCLVEARARAPVSPDDEAAGRRRLAEDEAEWLAPTTAAETAAGAVLHPIARLLARLLFRLQVRGIELLPVEPPFVIIANHVSDLDPPLLAAGLPLARLRRLYWAGDRGRLFGSGVQRKFARIVHLFPVDERAPGATLEMAGRVLARGQSLVWFPESWRSPDGELQRFRSGIGRLLLAQPVPAVPAFIDGTFQAMPRERRWPRPHPVTITFGKPVMPATFLEAEGTLPQGTTGEPASIEAAASRIADRLRSEVAKVVDAARRQPAPRS